MIWFILIIVAVIAYRKHTEGTYYQTTKTSPLQLYSDKGKFGEYMIYKCLQNAEKGGAKFLFNIYIPKDDGKTTEIDVLMIHKKGLFVFESKNYSGWIFGSEFQKNWCQTLPQGKNHSRKEYFYNPIMQNNAHIKHLRTFVPKDLPMHSIIVFSERCTLKKVEVTSTDVHVIKRNDLYNTVAAICTSMETPVLSVEEINEIYDKLYPYTQVDAAVKSKHIEDIKNRCSTEEKTKIYNKLVRDNIPDIIAARGATCDCRTLTNAEYLDALNAKLDEEVAEYHESGSIEELADILEVIGAIAEAKGCQAAELDRIRSEKTEKRGGFRKKTMLLRVTEK